MVGKSFSFIYPFIKYTLSIYKGTALAVKDNEDIGPTLRLLIVQWKS